MVVVLVEHRYRASAFINQPIGANVGVYEGARV